MKQAIIVGAGLSGLIAGAILRGDASVIVERQKGIPNNHHALLRFRSHIVGEATGIHFRRVDVMKAVHNPTNPVADAARYSIKVGGRAVMRSISGATGKIEQRYIAPPDLVERLSRQVSCPIKLGTDFRAALDDRDGAPVISTMPMPALMEALGYEGPRPEFESRAGWSIRVDLPRDKVDFCGTLYYPDPGEPQYRASITDSTLIVEGVGENLPEVDFAHTIAKGCLIDLGLGVLVYPGSELSGLVVHRQAYAKIMPVDDDTRKRFILWASDAHGIYSLGRFATWRPGMLLDDLVQDIRIIQRMMNGDSSTPYRARK